MNRTRTILALLTLTAVAPAALAQLSPPPGPVTPTFKTLDQIQPSIPIGPDTTPGATDAVFKITQPGAYHLTGNIAGEAGKHGIQIASSNVTIDLRGFTLMGVAGSLNGVDVDPYDTDHSVTVRNGSVTSWGERGIDLGGCNGSVVEDVSASYNTQSGVYAWNYARIARVIAIGNGDDGIYVYSSGVIRDCTAADNIDHGVFAGPGSTTRGCTANDNGGYGFYISSQGTATNCSARNNDDAGFYAFLGCVITDCTAGYNTIGFSLNRANTLRDCNATSNTEYGVKTTDLRNRIENNTATSSPTCFSINGYYNFASGNTAGNADTEYEISSYNLVAPISQSVSGTTPPFSNFRR